MLYTAYYFWKREKGCEEKRRAETNVYVCVPVSPLWGEMVGEAKGCDETQRV